MKGLCKKARAGLIHEFTGVDDPCEVPPHPEIMVETTRMTPAESAGHVISELEPKGWLPQREPAPGLLSRHER